MFSLANEGERWPMSYNWKLVIAWFAGLIVICWLLAHGCFNSSSVTNNPIPPVASMHHEPPVSHPSVGLKDSVVNQSEAACDDQKGADYLDCLWRHSEA
jgi:hypothetical protein